MRKDAPSEMRAIQKAVTPGGGARTVVPPSPHSNANPDSAVGRVDAKYAKHMAKAESELGHAMEMLGGMRVSAKGYNGSSSSSLSAANAKSPMREEPPERRVYGSDRRSSRESLDSGGMPGVDPLHDESHDHEEEEDQAETIDEKPRRGSGESTDLVRSLEETDVAGAADGTWSPFINEEEEEEDRDTLSIPKKGLNLS